MNRTTATGLLLSLLGAAAGCGDEDFVCQLDVCGTGCVNLQADNANCGACFNECGSGTACMAGTCEPTELVCDAPTQACGEDCVDVMTDAANCGECDNACAAFSECVDGTCAGPLVALRTVERSKGDLLRDVYVVDDDLDVHKLGNPIADLFFDRVGDLAVMPDGHVLFVGAQEVEGVFELWISAPDGTGLTRLNPTFIDGRVDEVLAVSADSSTVLFRASLDGVPALYTVKVATPGVVTKVNDDLGLVSRVYALDATGGHAIYIQNDPKAGVNLLFLRDLTDVASTPLVINAPLNTGTVFDFVLSPDGTKLVYRGLHDASGAQDLFYVDLTAPGTAHQIANSTFKGPYRAGEDYQFTADGSAVVYRGSDSFFDDSLFIVSLAGPTFDSTPLATNIDATSGGIRSRVALTGDAAYYIKDVVFGDARLFKAAFATPDVVEPVFDGVALTVNVDHVAVSPDGTQLVFGAGGDGGESGNVNPGTDGPNDVFGFSTQLYYVDLTAPLPATPVLVVDATASQGSVEGDFFVKNDGRIVMRGSLGGIALDTFIAHPDAPLTTLKIGPVLDLGASQSDAVRQLRRF